jgi:hypothetical protein
MLDINTSADVSGCPPGKENDPICGLVPPTGSGGGGGGGGGGSSNTPSSSSSGGGGGTPSSPPPPPPPPPSPQYLISTFNFLAHYPGVGCEGDGVVDSNVTGDYFQGNCDETMDLVDKVYDNLTYHELCQIIVWIVKDTKYEFSNCSCTDYTYKETSPGGITTRYCDGRIEEIRTNGYMRLVEASGSKTEVIPTKTVLDTPSLTVTGVIEAQNITRGHAPAAISDEKLKENIIGISNKYGSSIELLSKLNPVSFRWKDDKTNKSVALKQDIGLIAQEVEKVIPELVENIEYLGDYKGVKYVSIIPILIDAIKELSNRVEELERNGHLIYDSTIKFKGL